MTTRVTLADVAKRAGVHVTTVSLALRNHTSLPVSTKQRIKTLAEEMGYRRDPELQALMAYRRSMSPKKEAPPLAYVTCWDTRFGWKDNYAHSQFWTGATTKARSLGYNVEHFWLGEPNLTPQRLSAILYARGITGVIIASHVADSDIPLHFDWERFSAVKIDYFPHEPELHSVTNDQRMITQLAVRKIMAAGYRRVGVVMPRWWDMFVDRAWSAGYLAEQQDIDTEDRMPILYYGDRATIAASGSFNWSVPCDVLKDWLDQYKPEVVLSHRPFVRERFAELGISIPRDLAFVELFHENDGEETAGVHHNCERVGQLAVELLVGNLQQHAYGLPRLPVSTLVEGTWRDGNSLPLRVARREETLVVEARSLA